MGIICVTFTYTDKPPLSDMMKSTLILSCVVIFLLVAQAFASDRSTYRPFTRRTRPTRKVVPFTCPPAANLTSCPKFLWFIRSCNVSSNSTCNGRFQKCCPIGTSDDNTQGCCFNFRPRPWHWNSTYYVNRSTVREITRTTGTFGGSEGNRSTPRTTSKPSSTVEAEVTEPVEPITEEEEEPTVPEEEEVNETTEEAEETPDVTEEGEETPEEVTEEAEETPEVTEEVEETPEEVTEEAEETPEVTEESETSPE